MSDVDAKFRPVTGDDVTDEKLAAGELRALRREIRSGFERLFLQLDRFDQRLTSLELHRVDANERLDRHEHRIARLEAAAKTKP